MLQTNESYYIFFGAVLLLLLFFSIFGLEFQLY